MSFERNIEKIIDSMPSLPITVAKILEITKNPASTPNDLNRVISLDPVLTGRVLKLINSAYYGLGSQITSIVKAIIMLGLNTIKNLAISTAILGTVTKKENFKALNMDSFWRHSIAVGVTAKIIARKMNINKRLVDEYFIAGLLHDIGKIVINQHFDQLYVEVIQESDSQSIPLFIKEEELMKITHSGVGEKISEKWQLTGALHDCISFHHNPSEASEEHRRIVFSIAISNYFCIENEIGFAGDRCPEALSPEIWDFLGISESDLYRAESEINDEITKASVFLRVSEGAS